MAYDPNEPRDNKGEWAAGGGVGKAPKRTKGGRVIPTYELAMAAGKDAANASMKAAGRTSWNADDYNAMATTVDRLLGPEGAIIPAPSANAKPINGATGKPRRSR